MGEVLGGWGLGETVDDAMLVATSIAPPAAAAVAGFMAIDDGSAVEDSSEPDVNEDGGLEN